MLMLENLPKNKKIELSSIIVKRIEQLSISKEIQSAKQKLLKQKDEVTNDFISRKKSLLNNKSLYESYYKTTSYNLNRINLELLKIEQMIDRNNYYCKRLEILNKILLSNKSDNDDLYYEFLKLLKFGIIVDTQSNINIARSYLHISNYAKTIRDYKNILSKEGEENYLDSIIENTNKQEYIKKTRNSIGILKTLNFSQLTEFDSYKLFDNLKYNPNIKKK